MNLAEPKNNLLTKPRSVFNEAKTYPINDAKDEEINNEAL
jgi:hypothetical protein